MEIHKFEYLKNEMIFLDKIKNHLVGYHLVKNKNLLKMADTSSKNIYIRTLYLTSMYLVTIATMVRKMTASCCFECHFKSNVKRKASHKAIHMHLQQQQNCSHKT